MGVSADAPYNDIAYKLVQYGGRPVLKLSSGKRTLAGEKQVYRVLTAGRLAGDTIGLRGETLNGEPLLRAVMKGGQRVAAPEPLTASQERFRAELALLPDLHKALESPPEYPIRLSRALEEAQERVIHEVREKELGES